LIGIFLEELEEHKAKLEHGVLALERVDQPGARAEVLQELFRAAHSLKGAAQSVSADEIAALCHGLEQRFHDLLSGQAVLDQTFTGILLSGVDELARAAERVRSARAQVPAPAPKRSAPPDRAPPPRAATGPREAEPRKATPNEVAVRIERSKLDLLLADNDTLTTTCSRVMHRLTGLATLHEQARALTATLRRAQATAPARETQLDAFLDRAAHLESSLSQLDEGLHRDFHGLAQAVRRVGDDVRRVRMVPFSDICEGLERAVRDLSSSLDKELRLLIESADVEVDRAVAQRLRDPLLHLLRNAATHGIEPRHERAAAGKPSAGSLAVKARLWGSELEIVVEDDGRGLDLVALRARGELGATRARE